MTATLYLMLIVPILGAVFTMLYPHDKTNSSPKYHKIIMGVCATEFALCLIALFIFNKHTVYTTGTYFSINGLSILFLTLSSLIFLLQNILDPKIICKSPKLYTILFLTLETLVIWTLLAGNPCFFKVFFMLIPAVLFTLLTLTSPNKKIINNILLCINIAACLLSLIIDFYHSAIHPLTFTITYFTFIITGLISPIIAIRCNSAENNNNQNIILTTMTIPTIIGIYGISMLCAPNFSFMITALAPYSRFAFAVLVLYFSFMAFRQNNLSGIITNFACATISLIFVGSTLPQAFPGGAVFFTLNYPFILMALFAGANILFSRTQSLKLSKITGISATMPCFSVISFITTIVSISFPLTGGFIGYFLLLQATFPKHLIMSVFLSICLAINAIYLIGAYCSTMYGKPRSGTATFKDISIGEGFFILLCLGFSIGIGAFPDWFAEFWLLPANFH